MIIIQYKPHDYNTFICFINEYPISLQNIDKIDIMIKKGCYYTIFELHYIKANVEL